MIGPLGPDDVGQRVTYRELDGRGTIEEGVVSSLADVPGYVHVRYGADASCAQLTPLRRLEWSTRTSEQTAVVRTLRGGRCTAIDWAEPPRDPRSGE